MTTFERTKKIVEDIDKIKGCLEDWQVKVLGKEYYWKELKKRLSSDLVPKT